MFTILAKPFQKLSEEISIPGNALASTNSTNLSSTFNPYFSVRIILISNFKGIQQPDHYRNIKINLQKSNIRLKHSYWSNNITNYKRQVKSLSHPILHVYNGIQKFLLQSSDISSLVNILVLEITK